MCHVKVYIYAYQTTDSYRHNIFYFFEIRKNTEHTHHVVESVVKPKLL